MKLEPIMTIDQHASTEIALLIISIEVMSGRA
jgi:hypothetical protein